MACVTPSKPKYGTKYDLKTCKKADAGKKDTKDDKKDEKQPVDKDCTNHDDCESSCCGGAKAGQKQKICYAPHNTNAKQPCTDDCQCFDGLTCQGNVCEAAAPKP